MHSTMLEQTFLASHPFVPTRFQSHPHAHPLCSDLAVDLRFLPVRECSFNSPVSLSIYAICGKPGVVTTYNHHLRLLSPEPFGRLAPPKFNLAREPKLLWNHCIH
jgi:hypothetical protein